MFATTNSLDVNSLLAWVAGVERILTRNMTEVISIEEMDFYLNQPLPIRLANLPAVRKLYDRLYSMRQGRNPTLDVEKLNQLVRYIQRVIGSVETRYIYREDEDTADYLLGSLCDTIEHPLMDQIIEITCAK